MAQRLLVVIGLTLVAAGLIVGFGLPVYAGDSDCGSAFIDGSDAAEIADTFEGGTGALGCAGERSDARPLPVVLLILGAGLGVGATLTATPRLSASATKTAS